MTKDKVSYYDVRLIDTAYIFESGGGSSDRDDTTADSSTTTTITADDVAVIQLFGKTRDNKSILINHHGYKPYLYVVELPTELEAKLRADERVTAIEFENLKFSGDGGGDSESEIVKRCAKIIVSSPKHIAKIRKLLKAEKLELYATDIPYATRFIYDYNLNACIRVKGIEETGSNYPVELVINARDYEYCEEFKPQLKVMSFDIETSIRTGELRTICCVLALSGNKRSDSGDIGGSSDNSNELLERVALTGDDERKILTEFVTVVQRWDPDIITGYNIEGFDFPTLQERAKKYNIKLALARDGSELRGSAGSRQWRIHGRLVIDVWLAAKRELNPRKETLEYLAETLLGDKKLPMDPLKLDDIWTNQPEKVIEYCMKDAELALRILEKLGVVSKIMDLSTVAKLPMDDVLANRPSVLIDSLLIREANKLKIAVPDMKKGAEREEFLETTAGGRVAGGYVHDVKPGLTEWVAVLDFKSMYPSIIINKNICFTTLLKRKDRRHKIEFESAQTKVGLIPRVLSQLMADREAAKEAMRRARTTDERQYYNGLQQAIKILMNSFYGVLASAFYRFTNPDIGDSITRYGRELTKSIIKTLEDDGYKVLYADTDSIFVASPYPELEKSVEFGSKLADRFSASAGITLELERVLQTFFTHGKKKRYAGKSVWPSTELIVRGYEIRRRDAFELQNEALTAVFEHVLDNDIDGARRLARKYVSDTLQGKVPASKLAITKTVRSEKEYDDPQRIAGIKVAKKLQQLGYEFVSGMKVSWIVTDAKQQPQCVEPYIDGREFEYVPDYQYYAERLATTLAQVTEVFGLDERGLLSKGVQRTLF